MECRCERLCLPRSPAGSVAPCTPLPSKFSVAARPRNRKRGARGGLLPRQQFFHSLFFAGLLNQETSVADVRGRKGIRANSGRRNRFASRFPQLQRVRLAMDLSGAGRALPQARSRFPPTSSSSWRAWRFSSRASSLSPSFWQPSYPSMESNTGFQLGVHAPSLRTITSAHADSYLNCADSWGSGGLRFRRERGRNFI